MKKILAYSLLLLGAFVLFSMNEPARDNRIITKKKFSKSMEKTFPINKKGEVAIVNKYGSIDMHTWDKSEVQIKVVIVVNATSESVAEDVFDRITIEFEGSSQQVQAETVIEDKNDYWWNWGRHIKSDFEINYQVFMPITCSVQFDNKYGNINMMDLENDANIQVKYGNLTMGDLEGDLNLELGYGNGFVGAVNDVRAEVKYSKLRCDYTGDFTGETKYSGLTLNNAKKVVVESKYDNYNLGIIGKFINEGKYDNFIIDQVDEVSIETKYTDLKIGRLNTALAAEMNYGSIRINELSKDFEEISLESEYAGLSVAPEKGCRFDLEMVGKYVDLNLPESLGVDLQKDGQEKYIQAKYNGGGKARIQCEMNYGFLTIK